MAQYALPRLCLSLLTLALAALPTGCDRPDPAPEGAPQKSDDPLEAKGAGAPPPQAIASIRSSRAAEGHDAAAAPQTPEAEAYQGALSAALLAHVTPRLAPLPVAAQTLRYSDESPRTDLPEIPRPGEITLYLNRVSARLPPGVKALGLALDADQTTLTLSYGAGITASIQDLSLAAGSAAGLHMQRVAQSRLPFSAIEGDVRAKAAAAGLEPAFIDQATRGWSNRWGLMEASFDTQAADPKAFYKAALGSLPGDLGAAYDPQDLHARARGLMARSALLSPPRGLEGAAPELFISGPSFGVIWRKGERAEGELVGSEGALVRVTREGAALGGDAEETLFGVIRPYAVTGSDREVVMKGMAGSQEVAPRLLGHVSLIHMERRPAEALAFLEAARPEALAMKPGEVGALVEGLAQKTKAKPPEHAQLMAAGTALTKGMGGR